MSKFLPIFKKKGKGKDEEGIHEPRKKVKGKEEEALQVPRKKRSKVTKTLKEVNPLSGISMSPSKHDKKRKSGKRKAPIPNAKDILSVGYDRERPVEFFVDDSGTIKEGPAELYVDERGAVREGPGEQFTDLTLEVDGRGSESSKTMVDNLEASHRLEDNESVETEDIRSADITGKSEYTTLDFDIDKYISGGRRVEDEDPGDEGLRMEVHCEKEANSSDPIEEEEGKEEKSVCNDVLTTSSEYHVPKPNDTALGPDSINSTWDANGSSQSGEGGDYTVDPEFERVQCQVTEGEGQHPPKEPEKVNLDIPKSNFKDTVEPSDNISSHTSDEIQETSTDKIQETSTDKIQETSTDKIQETSTDEIQESSTDEIQEISTDKIQEISTDKIQEASTDIPSSKEDESDQIDTGERNIQNDTDGKVENEEDVLCEQLSREDQSSPTSQDSDDDFDSAQEDWEDDYEGRDGPESRVQLEVSHVKEEMVETTNGVLIDRQVGQPGDPQVVITNELNETVNEALVCEAGEEDVEQVISRGLSSSSSLYLDAQLSRENSEAHDISSLAEDVSEGAEDIEALEDRKTSGQHPKLTRKTSTASSDVFDQELDELLDEELDRLSEEEEAEATHPRETPPEETGLQVDTITSTAAAHEPVEEEQVHSVTRAEERPAQDKEASMPKTDVDDKISDGVEPASGTDSKSTVTSEPLPGDTSSSHQDRSQESSEAKAPTRLSPEDVQEQTKDSGYYSLPVSPAVARGSDPPPTTSLHPDDSFGDSEEDGMVTPPSEITESSTKSIPSSEAPTPTSEMDSIQEESVIVNSQAIENPVESKSDILHQVAYGGQDTVEGPPATTRQVEENTRVSPEKGRAAVGGSETDDQKKLLQLTMPRHTTVELKDEVVSPRSGSSTPTRHSRHKTSVTGGEEAVLSPDPVGDHFLKQAMCMSHEAEARLAQRRAARAEARELRLRELEKQQHEQDNEEDKQPSASPYPEVPAARGGLAGRASGGRGAGVNCIAGGQFSRRSSEDSTTDETLPANVREMRAELKELDEKFRKAMITNAQLDNEKATLTFEVELMKDHYTELEETQTQLTKEHRKKCSEYEQLRKVSTKLQEEVKVLRGLLQERDQLIQEYGLVVVGEEEEIGEEAGVGREVDVDDLSPRKISVKKVLISHEAAELLSKGAASGSLDVRLKKFGEEKNDLEDQVRRLKLELEEERCKNRRRENGLDYEKQKEQSKTVNEYRFRVQKAEAEVATLQANVARLDALSTRYKTQSEELEKSEEELKLEKRKLQRELRDAQSRLEEVETTNNHLIKRFDKLKNARSNLLKDLSQDPA